MDCEAALTKFGRLSVKNDTYLERKGNNRVKKTL